jgi:hypothetical protein
VSISSETLYSEIVCDGNILYLVRATYNDKVILIDVKTRLVIDEATLPIYADNMKNAVRKPLILYHVDIG